VKLAASAALDGERVLLADMPRVSYAVGLITPPTNGANALVGSTAALDSMESPTLYGAVGRVRSCCRSTGGRVRLPGSVAQG